MNEVREASRPYAVDESSAPAERRPVRLFRNGANQAVRIPKEFELPGQDALIWREGDRLVIEVVKPEFPKGSPQAMLAALDAMEAVGPGEALEPDPWAEIRDAPTEPEDIFGDLDDTHSS